MEKASSRVVVEVNGVGYEIFIPFSTYYDLGEVQSPVSLHIYTHVKEDALNLYGFLTREEKDLFTQVIQVSGIGPRLGIAVLSGLPVDEFVEALRQEDVIKLNRIPGVGKKTAERLVLELKDKITELFPRREEAKAGISGSVQADVVSALINLGYPRNAAEKAVSRAREKGQSERFDDLLKKSLRRIQT